MAGSSKPRSRWYRLQKNPWNQVQTQTPSVYSTCTNSLSFADSSTKTAATTTILPAQAHSVEDSATERQSTLMARRSWSVRCWGTPGIALQKRPRLSWSCKPCESVSHDEGAPGDWHCWNSCGCGHVHHDEALALDVVALSGLACFWLIRDHWCRWHVYNRYWTHGLGCSWLWSHRRHGCCW